MRQIRYAQGTPITLHQDLSGIEDKYTREAFRAIYHFLHAHDILRGGFRLITYDAQQTGVQTVDHGLPLVPKDIFVTFTENVNTVTIDYQSITDTNFEITTTAKGKICMLAGHITEFDVTR